MTQVFPSRFIRAGAGAGKTTTLIRTFFDFVENFRKNHNRLPKVIITTFTRKATQEVKERLLLQALKVNEPELFQYINKKSSVHISTIHGVLSLLLNKNHDLLGLSSDIQISDSKTLIKIYYRELKQLFKKHSEYFELLEHYTFKDLVGLAVKFHELSNEHNLNYAGQQVLMKMRENILSVARQDFEKILSIHDEMASHKSWGPYFDYLSQFNRALSTQPFQLESLKAAYDEKPKRRPPYSKDKPPFDSDINELIAKYFSSESDFIKSIDTDDYILEHENILTLFQQMAMQFHQHMTDKKMRTGKISIADLESLSLRLIKEFPEEVRQFSDQYDYFMVDEYQDTSPLQVSILNSLIGLKSQFIVGDPQQSIYLFRGARSEVFQNKQSAAEKAQHEIISLTTNYRSDQKLMMFLNTITSRFSKQFSPMQTKAPENQYNTQAYFIKTQDDYSAIVQHISNLHSQGIAFSDICVLFNKNDDIFDFAKYAIKYRVPVQPLIAAGFDRKREVLDLAAFLKFLVNPHDNLNLHILLRSPWFEMTDVEMAQCHQEITEGSFWQKLKKQNHAVAKVLQSYLLGYRHTGVMSVLEKFIIDSKFLHYSLLLDPTGKREANIYKFIANLKEAVRQDDFILNDYLSAQFSSFQEDLSSNLNESIALFSGNRVSLMTIHGSKGLQFKHVILTGLASAPKKTRQLQFIFDESSQCYDLPILDNEEMKLTWSAWGDHQKALLNQREEQEYERLFYVAVTRAEKSISFIANDKKNPAKESWMTKMDWPVEGDHSMNDYLIKSQRLDDEASVLNIDQRADTVLKKPLVLNLTLPDVQEISKVSVTELIADKGAHSPAENSQADRMIENLNKAQKGTDLHRLFEATKFLDRNFVLGRANATEKAALNWLFQLKDIPFEKILQQGYAEWGFGLKTKMGVLQGQIDLWAQIGDLTYILDYKTGSSYFSEKALQQLQRYAEALKKMGYIKEQGKVQLVVLYPFEEKTVIKALSGAEVQSL